jgi:hypothetical protein
VILATANSNTRMNLGAALADDDVAGDHGLTAEFFHTESVAA